MITSLNVLYCQQSDLFEIKQRFSNHPPEKTLIQVFSGWVQKNEIERLLHELKEVFPDTPIVGTTTAGEIIDSKVTENTVVVNFSFFDSTTIQTTIVGQSDELWSMGKIIARDLAPSDPTAIIMFGCSLKEGRTIDASQILNALYEELPQTVIAGAQAGDNGNAVMSYVFTEDGIVEYGAAAASLSGTNLNVQNSYNLSWVPIGKKLTITKASGSRVYSIDQRSPLELYQHYLGQEVVNGLPLTAADFPLIMERDGITMALHAIGVNDDGSFDYIHSFAPGEEVQFGFCHSGLLSLAAEETFDQLRLNSVQAAFIYSCVSRKWVLGEDIDVEIAPIATLAPTAGFFAYGEYFTHPQGKCLFFSQTMTVLTLTELDRRDEGQISSVIDNLKPLPIAAETKQLKTLRALHRLVETSANEIETANKKLARIAHQDGLTGLSNRRYFDQQLAIEFEQAEKSQIPLSLVLIDVDDFKLYNDTYGHLAGDVILRKVATVLYQVSERAGDFVGRYGGEEFVCILPDTNFTQAMLLAEKIRQDISKLEIPHATSRVGDHLTVSIGVQTIDIITQQITPELLFVMCDKQLYAAKEAGRNQVCGQTVELSG
ncbi:MAG: diguanylate cyclase [Cyanobacteria bacterium P01_A01_bin.83]